MTAAANRASTYTSVSVGSDGKNGEQKKDLWTSLLEDTKGKSGKKLAEKNLVVLGGTPQMQRDFLESLSNGDSRRNADRQSKMPPLANSYALGYTYYDVLDADQEDILARISLSFLSSCTPAFAPLLAPLLTPITIPDTLLVVLLDWNEPWLWLRRLRCWLQLVQLVLRGLSTDCKETMEDVMSRWSVRGRERGGVNLDGTEAVADVAADGGVLPLPHGPGEWEDALGLPLCVVCQNAEEMDTVATRMGWKDDMFDVILQHLRTVLLRHGASLIYTPSSGTSLLQPLIHSSLGIHSLLKKTRALQPNTIERDKIIVPPNWDSWSKILILRDGFDVEAVSNGWARDLDEPLFPAVPARGAPPASDEEGASGHQNGDHPVNGAAAIDEPAQPRYPDPIADYWQQQSALDQAPSSPPRNAASAGPPSAQAVYERSVQPPPSDIAVARRRIFFSGSSDDDGEEKHAARLDVATVETQPFLEQQQPILEALKRKDREELEAKAAAEKGGSGGDRDKNSLRSSTRRAQMAITGSGTEGTDISEDAVAASRMEAHIGPVQFNVGGIQVDADDMVQRLKERTHTDDGEISLTLGQTGNGDSSVPGPFPGADMADNEKLEAFFSGLMKRSTPGGGVGAGSPFSSSRGAGSGR